MPVSILNALDSNFFFFIFRPRPPKCGAYWFRSTKRNNANFSKKISGVSTLNPLESISDVSLFFLLNKCHSFLLIDCDVGFWPITRTVFNLALWNFYNSIFGISPTIFVSSVSLIIPFPHKKGGNRYFITWNFFIRTRLYRVRSLLV